VKPLSFGGGIHYCVGAALARAEARAAFQRLVSLPRELALTERPEWRPGINLRALKRLSLSLAHEPWRRPNFASAASDYDH
jgi:cytochrome P450